MRRAIFTLFAISFAAIITLAQNTSVSSVLTTLPDCAKPCFTTAVDNICNASDALSCICHNDKFRPTTTTCVRQNCSPPDIFDYLRREDELCDRPRRDRRMEVWPYISIHIFSILCAVIRIYTKTFVIRKFSPEDWLALSYFIIYIVYFGIGHNALMSAFGRDIWWIKPEDLAHALKLFWIDIPFYTLLLGLTKISIILFYIRLCHVYKAFCRICWMFMFAIGLNTIALIFLSIFQCSPIRWNWDRYRHNDIEAQCLNLNALNWSINITNIIFDVVVLVLPIPLVAKLKTTLRRKIAIIFMFSLGIVVLVASCLKMRYNILYGNSSNITWDYMYLMVWAGIETSVSVAAPCLPTVRLFLHSVCPNLFGRIFTFGAQGETSLDEYIKGEEDEVAQWSADMEKPTHDNIPVKRPRRAVTAEREGRIYENGQDGTRKKKAMTEASRILKSVDDIPSTL